MPEIKKYLNREGLEEYNSLLPHSSAEMQTYVNEWLDEHPEATTTVQDGAITEPKLADKSVSLRTLADDTVHMLKGAILTGNLSGEVLTADDAYSAPPIALTVDGKSTQDGTPTPDAPVEIVSVEQPELNFAGKQLMDWAHPFRTGTYNYDVAVGTVIQSGTSAAVNVTVDASGKMTVVINTAWTGAIWRSPNLPNGTYYIYLPLASDGGTGSGTSYGSTLFIVDKNNKVLRKYNAHASTGNWSYAVTLTGDEAAICVNAGTRSGTTNKTFIYDSPKLEVGNVLTNYAPFSMQSVQLPVTLRSLPDGTKDTLALSYLRPSTREGWAWYSRELVQRVGSIDLGDQTWTTSGTGTAQKYATIISPPMPYGWLGAAAYMCSAYITVPSRASSSSMPDDSVGNRATRGDVVYVRDTRFVDEPDPTALKAALSGVRFDYVLNGSYIQTHTLDPIELPILPAPDVTVWSDPSTGLQMEYVRDANIVIQNIEQAIADQ